MTNTPNMINGLINEFNDDIFTQIKEKMSKTKPFVDVISVEKKETEIDNMGGVKFVENNDAFAKVEDVKTDPKYGKRLLGTRRHLMSVPINTTIADMTSAGSSKIKDKIIEEVVASYVNLIDKVVYSAFDANVSSKDGTVISFSDDGGQTIDLKAAADFTVDKILEAKQKLTKQGFGVAENSGIAFLLSDVERTYLEKDTSISNADYKIGYGVKQDDDGNLKRFKGIDLITLASVGNESQPTIFTTTGSTLGTHYRKTFMFNTGKNGYGKSAITLGLRKNLVTDIFEDKSYYETIFVKGMAHLGAIRNAYSGVVLIKSPVSL